MSGGQQQRVSIARAIAKRPRLLLCDEPTGALDTNTGKEVIRLLQSQAKDEGRTVIIVTHNDLFAQLADKVIFVKNGTVFDVVLNEHPKTVDEVEW